ncbi:hypothetical protein ACFV0B_22545 [Streptomyces xanthophaeus]|uniref:hypothetical protein n=1 Tax=Streptomyces xanthophaeus TaxID=67385 RepID=UPI002F9100F6|nr:hypothetical protein OG264_38510 [Streptomyces xanthophaeus]WST65795.1 hypothetical protein OG605_40155 [Streptomyces xanthophaeus]
MRLNLPVQNAIARHQDRYMPFFEHLFSILSDKGDVVAHLHGKRDGLADHDPGDPSPWLCCSRSRRRR